jgi:hypothetical protein
MVVIHLIICQYSWEYGYLGFSGVFGISINGFRPDLGLRGTRCPEYRPEF